MCGIVGILKREGSPPPQEAGLRVILCMIRHRGSDQFGVDLGGAGLRAIS